MRSKEKATSIIKSQGTTLLQNTVKFEVFPQCNEQTLTVLFFLHHVRLLTINVSSVMLEAKLFDNMWQYSCNTFVRYSYLNRSCSQCSIILDSDKLIDRFRLSPRRILLSLFPINAICVSFNNRRLQIHPFSEHKFAFFPEFNVYVI